MKSVGAMAETLAPWAGLSVGITAWAINHQFGSDGLFDDCAAFSPGPVMVVALIAMAATLVAGAASWRSFKRDEAGDALRVVAVISVGTAALFCLAILYPMLAAMIIPPCFQ